MDTQKAKTTPKDFFLWAGAIVTFYWSVVAFLQLMFTYIDYAFPNVLAPSLSDPYQSGMSYEMASLIVMFPIFLLLMYFIRRDITRDPSRSDLWVRRWALFLTLFVAGLTMAVSVITLLNTFLSGTDIVSSFLLKIALVFLVAAAVFMHFIADLRGYWKEFPSRALTMSYATGALMILTIAAGFIIVGTPQHARLLRFDAQKISDLQTLQGEVLSYFQQNQTLPPSLSALTSALPGFSVPIDPQSGDTYTYHLAGKTSFELCATFNAPSVSAVSFGPSAPAIPAGAALVGADNWQHVAGNVCFSRSVTPQTLPKV